MGWFNLPAQIAFGVALAEVASHIIDKLFR